MLFFFRKERFNPKVGSALVTWPLLRFWDSICVDEKGKLSSVSLYIVPELSALVCLPALDVSVLRVSSFTCVYNITTAGYTLVTRYTVSSGTLNSTIPYHTR